MVENLFDKFTLGNSDYGKRSVKAGLPMNTEVTSYGQQCLACILQ